MNEYFLNLKSWEVQAILSGRKTQILTPLKQKPYLYEGDWFWPHGNLVYGLPKPKDKYPEFLGIWDALHQWKPGTRRWVRETWANEPGPISGKPTLFWKDPDNEKFFHEVGYKWRSPATMPRWASRINLVIKRSWIERVQDISENDAFAEGCQGAERCTRSHCGTKDWPDIHFSARDDFGCLWDTIYKAPFDWSSNPWVIVVEFEVGK